jgi:hypothetical protein
MVSPQHLGQSFVSIKCKPSESRTTTDFAHTLQRKNPITGLGPSGFAFGCDMATTCRARSAFGGREIPLLQPLVSNARRHEQVQWIYWFGVDLNESGDPEMGTLQCYPGLVIGDTLTAVVFAGAGR